MGEGRGAQGGGDICIFMAAYGFPSGSDGIESACNAGDLGSIPEFGQIPWRRNWQPTPVFLPGKFHRQRNLLDYSPWTCKELDTTE